MGRENDRGLKLRQGKVGAMVARLSLVPGLCGLAVLLATTFAWGEPKAGLKGIAKSPAKSGAVRSTTVEMILLSADGGGIQAQQWRSTLESLNVPFSIRRGQEGEQLETTEKVIGTLRTVTAVGKLERSGQLVFGDRTFQPGDRQQLKKWVTDLQTYGAQGTPDGKPVWGLNEAQFAAVYSSLTELAPADTRDQELERVIAGLPLPAESPVRWSEAALRRLTRSGGQHVVRQNVKGFAAATALAVILNDEGLGFRPHRTPEGTLELLIDVPESPADAWPVGWALKLPRQKAAPNLFRLQQVFFDETPLTEVLATAARSAEITILFDFADLERAATDWQDLKFSYPPRQATWFTVIKDALNKQKLSFDLWQDEAGRPFLYVTSLRSKRTAPK